MNSLTAVYTHLLAGRLGNQSSNPLRCHRRDRSQAQGCKHDDLHLRSLLPQHPTHVYLTYSQGDVETFSCSPFHVRFGKLQVLRAGEKRVRWLLSR